MTSFICLICHVGHSLATDTLIQLLLLLNSLVYKNDRSGKRKFETASEEEGLSQ